MRKKIGALGVLGAAIAVVVATTLSGTASARLAVGTAAVSCNSPVTIGVAYPATGPAASLGALQWDWAKFARDQWNAAHPGLQIALAQGDTQLAGATPQATQVAHAFANNNSIVAVVGPAGSQEQQDTASIWVNGGLAPISGSSTRVALTRGSPRETTKGFFFRTVPNDGQQGQNVANYIHNKLHKTKVEIIDDEESYSTGLAAQVKADLHAAGVTVVTNHISQSDTNFSSVIDAIPSGVNLIYIPWQVASQAQQFYVQLAQHGKNIPLFGSDGTDDPSTFHGAGSYLSAFPYAPSNPTVQAFKSAHGGNLESFGLPTYTAVLANAMAIKSMCTAHHGVITRLQVRNQLTKVTVPGAQALLGFAVSFLSSNNGKFQGAGDMGGKAGFGIYKIDNSGNYNRVG
jgi:ABC-type branched-subunit amino acid transport system substrate-binding protein